MVKAVWNGITLAESEGTKTIEGNHYFPPESIKKQFFKESDYHTTCPWKGTASYYDIVVGEKVNENAAWYYREPKTEEARKLNFANYVAFWKGVTVTE
jgi:uncharacterized protein (DUF427 family)